MKVLMVTGASSGFGRRIAEEALHRGWKVVATVRDTDVLADLAKAHPRTLMVLKVDVANRDDVNSAVERAEAWAGTIDVLVNNAGYGVHGAVEEVSAEETAAIYGVNVFGLLHVTRAVLPVMRRRHGGHVINISSMGGLVAGPGSGIYASTKFAVEGLSEALLHELAPIGIKVTVVEPGPFRTDFNGRSIKVASAAIPDYAETAAARSAALRARSGKQPGDPEKAARIICDITESAEPPFHLLLGNAAMERVRPKIEALLEEIDRWEKLSRSADYDPD